MINVPRLILILLMILPENIVFADSGPPDGHVFLDQEDTYVDITENLTNYHDWSSDKKLEDILALLPNKFQPRDRKSGIYKRGTGNIWAKITLNVKDTSRNYFLVLDQYSNYKVSAFF